MQQQATEPLISIALCTYNGARYLREQLDSVLTQTYRNIEIIAVDDGSTDETVAILREYELRDARLRVHVNPANLGFRANFERALSLCTGEFIAPCDQDDIWLAEKLEMLRGIIGQHAMAYCDSIFIDEQGNATGAVMSDSLNMISSSDPAQFVAGNCVAGHAMLFRRQLLVAALPVPGCFYYDWWLAAVAAGSGGLVYCEYKLVKYRLHAGNVTNVLRERPAEPKQGRRGTRLRDFGLRTEQLSRLPGASHALLRRLHALWVAREDQWLSPALAAFLYRHWRRLFAVRKSRWRLVPAMKFTVGLRTKRLTSPKAYRL